MIETPCYGSALELARSTGAEREHLAAPLPDGWAHDLDALESLLRADTRLIYLNSPHNPTGTQMPRAVFERVLEIARERSIVLFGDEVYAASSTTRPPTAGGVRRRGARHLARRVSKAHGLPGLRIGWLACARAGC